MSPGQAVVSMYLRYFDFQGRSPRSGFWWVLAYILLVEALFAAIAVPLTLPAIQAAQTGGTPPQIPVLVMAAGGLLLLWALATVIPYLALLIRRMHDIDKSGFVLFFYLIPVVGLVLLIVWLLTAGTKGPNRFGPDPLA